MALDAALDVCFDVDVPEPKHLVTQVAELLLLLLVLLLSSAHLVVPIVITAPAKVVGVPCASTHRRPA